MAKLPQFDFAQNIDPNLPLPEQIIAHLGGDMICVDTVEGKRLYCVRDWVYFVSTSKSSDRTPSWANLKRGINKDIAKDIDEGKAKKNLTVETLLNLQRFAVETASGKQLMDFTDEEGLYQVTQRMSDRSKTVRDVKTFLAKSGVFMGEAYRNPQAAAAQLQTFFEKREYEKLLAEGFTPDEAMEWLHVRHKQKEQRNIITHIWKIRGIKKPRDFADLTNRVHNVALGRTASRHKRELRVKDTPRNHVSAADNATLQITELTCGLLHTHRDSLGKAELSEDIDDTQPVIDAARPEIQKLFSQKPRRIRGNAFEQLSE